MFDILSFEICENFVLRRIYSPLIFLKKIISIQYINASIKTFIFGFLDLSVHMQA